MGEIRIPGSDAIRDIADLVDHLHRLRIAITGTSSQPGLLAQVESARPVVDQLRQLLGEFSEQNIAAIELAQLLDAHSRELLLAIPDRLLGTVQSELFAERVKIAMTQSLVEIGHEIALARLELAANQIVPEAGEAARKVIDEILAKNQADSVVALDHKIERLIGQHQIAMEHAEDALAKAQRANERMEKQRDQAENRLQIERRMQGKNSLQWGVLAFAAGIGLTIFLYQPAFVSLSNFVKTL